MSVDGKGVAPSGVSGDVGSMRIPPVGEPLHGADAYERGLRKLVLTPWMSAVRAAMRRVHDDVSLSVDDVERAMWRALDAATATILALTPTADVVRLVRSHMVGASKWHRRRLLATFRRVGVDLSPLMLEAAVRQALSLRVGDNVSLIRTIPRRLHASLEARIRRQMQSRSPTLLQSQRFVRMFDPHTLAQLLRDQYGAGGYILRRLARDQTTKAIAHLTQIRHRQAGINDFFWVHSGGDNARPHHEALHGQRFSWDDPPYGGPGHEIQCRCQAAPALSARDIALLKAA